MFGSRRKHCTDYALCNRATKNNKYIRYPIHSLFGNDSFEMIYFESNVLSYYNCNYDSIWTCIVIVVLMIASTMIVKVFVYGDVFKVNKFCYPPAFVFGDMESGKMLQKIVRDKSEVMYKIPHKNEGFKQRSINMYGEYLDIVQSVPKTFIQISEHIEKTLYQFIQERGLLLNVNLMPT